MGKELYDKIFALIKKKKTIDEIVEITELKKEEVIGIVKIMNDNGYMCDYVNGEIILLKKPIKTEDVYTIPNKLDKLKLLIISDTHLVNKADRLDILKYVYDRAEKEKCNCVLHVGD